jgi:hypothetical protein
MSDYTEFFLNSNSNVIQLELLEISHPSFSQTYFIVRNKIAGVTVTLEDSSSQFFEYYPLKITPVSNSDDLDQTIKVELGDLGTLLPQELDAVAVAGTFDVKPTLIYRTYRSDDLSAPLSGPVRYEISNIPFNKDGSSFEARAPRLNQLATGELYTLDRFPALKGFL